jgi:hypothetical protein
VAGPFAIEHTSIDTIPGQREASVPFMRSLGRLEAEVTVPFNLEIAVKWGAIQKRQDYDATRLAVRRWIVEDSASLPLGRHKLDIPGVPFTLTVWKRDDIGPGTFISRFEPNDDTLSDRLKLAIEDNARKLSAWPNHSRVLLIENDDIALMNHIKFWDALRRAYPTGMPRGVDQIWYAETCGRNPRFIKMTNDAGVISASELP